MPDAPFPAGSPPLLAPGAALHRLSFLAQASEVLASSLDYEQTLRDLARLAVPAIADACVVDVVEQGYVRRVATEHVVPSKADLLDELRQRYPPTLESPQPAARVIRTGQAELLSAVDPEVVSAHTWDAEHAALIRALAFRSHMAVPLVARGATVGVIGLAVSESEWRYTADDLAFVQDLARRAALAVDNARLYQTAQQELSERRRAEEALRLSEERFRAVMEQSPLSIQIFDAQGTHIRVNKAWEQLWGVTHDAIPDYNILHDHQLEVLGIASLIRRAFAGEAVALPAVRYDPNETVPDRSRHPDPVRWVRAFAYPVRDASGDVREVVLVHEDVTAARNADAKLRASEERLRVALGAGRMNVWEWDLASDIVECSEGAEQFWGTALGCAADFIRVIHPDDRDAVAEAGRQATSGDGTYLSEYRLVRPDGSVRWVQSRGRVELDASGAPTRILGVTVDVTDLKAAQQATRLLADAGETLGASLDYHATLHHLTHLVVPRIADWCAVDLVDESGRLQRVSVNHPDAAQVRVAADLFARYPPRPGDAHGALRVLATGEPEWSSEITDGTLQAVAHDAEHLALLRSLGLRSYICVPLRSRGGSIGVLTLVYAGSGRSYTEADVALAADLAHRAAAAVENARLHQQVRAEDRRKDEFLATLAHELRNPLAPIRTGLALLAGSSDPAVLAHTRHVMERQVTHMVRLIDDLLDISRVTRGRVQLQKERVELASVLGVALETCRPILDAAGVALAVRMPEDPVVLDADRTRLAQVFSNLLSNAAKYTERGGRVEVDARREAGDLIVRVRDTGVGIPPEMLRQIFEMFVQVRGSEVRSQGGLGIGLTLVDRLVALHGGRVWAESGGAGRGSTFSVRLPVVTQPADAGPDLQPDLPAHATTPRRILVVDDNADAAETLASLLRLDGHQVETAADGPAALAMLDGVVPDVAFVDIGMPGMSGYEVARTVRAQRQRAGITLVAVTGWGQAEDRREAYDAGFAHHMTKPVDPRELRMLLARIDGAAAR